MRILYINHYAGSPDHGMEYRPYYLAREWVRSGHAVRIVASSNSHLRIQSPELAGAARCDQTIDGVDYTWLKTRRYSGNGVGRVLNMGEFIYRLYVEGTHIAAQFRPDVVIASSTYPMDIWPARRMAESCRAKLVFELHDLWPLTLIELGGMSRWHPFVMLVQAAERHVYRCAAAVVSILPNVHDHVAARGLALHRLHIVPNGVRPQEWPAQMVPLDPALQRQLDEITRPGGIVVGYAGNHGISNDLATLLDTARIMRDDRVSFVLVGAGPEKAALMHLAQRQRLQNVHFLGPVVKAQIPALLAHFDIAYIGWQRRPLYRFGIAPNKLMDYMMAARPVLHAVDAGNDAVSDAGCGLTVEPENADAAARGIRRLAGLSDSERQAMGQRGRQYVLQRFTYPVLSGQFLAACR